jgi:hypothetical protein
MIKIVNFPAGWDNKNAGEWRRTKVRKMMFLYRVAIWS